MTAGYDEWAVARTPSLLALRRGPGRRRPGRRCGGRPALDRTRAAWPRVSRDDPDLEARRSVVRACPTPRRAAVVLRVLEERSDAEIAEVLHCSESAARRHLQRGTGRARLPACRRPRSLTAVRDELDGARRLRPDPAPDPRCRPTGPTASTPRPGRTAGRVAGRPRRARPGLRRRPRRPRVALAGGRDPLPEGRASRAPGATSRTPACSSRCPDTWGWGASPVAVERSSPARGTWVRAAPTRPPCSRRPTTRRTSRALTQFVGRPAMHHRALRALGRGRDDAARCGRVVRLAARRSASGGRVGSVAETRAVGGQHVTVFGPDSSLRRQILGTAEQVDVDANGCPTRAVVRADGRAVGPEAGVALGLRLLPGHRHGGPAVLRRPDRAQRRGVRRARCAPRRARPARPCPTPQGRWVALGLHGAGGTRWDVVEPRVRPDPAGRRAALRP